MNTGFIILANELNDRPSCQIGFAGKKETSGEYRFGGYTVGENTEKDPEQKGQGTVLCLDKYLRI